MQTLGEFHDLKYNMFEKLESIIGGIKGDSPEEKKLKILKWFMHNEASTSPICSISFSPNVSQNIKGAKRR